jgi:hypothetical protein
VKAVQNSHNVRLVWHLSSPLFMRCYSKNWGQVLPFSPLYYYTTSIFGFLFCRPFFQLLTGIGWDWIKYKTFVRIDSVCVCIKPRVKWVLMSFHNSDFVAETDWYFSTILPHTFRYYFNICCDGNIFKLSCWHRKKCFKLLDEKVFKSKM